MNLRPAGPGDIPQLAALGAALAAQHRSYDPLRFVVAGDPLRTFTAFFEEELANPDAAIVVAEEQRTHSSAMHLRVWSLQALSI